MLRKLFTVLALGVASSAALLAGGCSSDNSGKPYALTGDKGMYGANGAGANSTLTPQERARYTDQKGRFHEEWVGQPGR